MIDRAALWFDLHSAARSLARRPGFSLTIAGILALALGALTATMAVVDGVLLRPLPFDHPERLVVICERHPSVQNFCVGSPPNAADWADRSQSFAAIGLARDWSFALRQDGRQTIVRGGLASEGVFQVFGFRAFMGRTFEASDLAPRSRVTLLSHAFWVSAFGRDPNIVGRSVTLDDSTWTVIGVLGPGAAIPTLADVQVWAPLPFPMRDPSRRGWRGFQVFAQLREDASRRQAAAAIRGVAQALAVEYPETNRDWGVEVRTVHDQVVGEARPLLLVFLTATGLVVLVAAANIASLMLARASGRSRELAVQAAVGGGRERMVRVLLLESLLLAALGTLAALVIARLALTGFLRVAPSGLPRLELVVLGWRAILGAVILGAGVAFLAGLPPILRLSRLDLSTALRASGAGAGTGESQRGRTALVIAQVAMAVTLLAGAGLLTRTFRNLQSWQPGFETGHLMVAWTSLSPGRYPESRMVSALQREVRAAVASVPGVQSVGGVSNGPLFGGEEPGTFRARDPGQHNTLTARWYDASDSYIETLGMTVSRGRAISSRDVPGSVPVAVVNETFARQMWPGQDPVGMRVALDEPGAEVREVIGVVRDIPPFRAGGPPTPEIWWPFDQAPRWGTYLVVRTSGSPELLADTIRDRAERVAPALQMGRFRTMGELIGQRLVSPRFNLALVAGFAGLALVMAVVGLYGLVSFVVNLRQRELAIRLALGASEGVVRRAVLLQGVTLVGAGAGCGLLGAVAIGRVLRSLLAGVSAFDPVSFLAVTALLVACGVLAAWVPAWRASRVDPIASLRAE